MKINSVIIPGKITQFLLVIIMATPFITRAQSFYDATDDVAGGLPVTLVSFNAAKISQHVRLDWSTAAEYNNSHFNVQRSFNGRDFNIIARVTGRGNSNITNNYSVLDSLVPNTNLYYRLQQVDFDGKSSLSATVLIKYNKQSAIELSVYPNPVINHTVMIGLSNIPAGVYSLSLKNQNGQTVFTSTLNQTGSSSNSQVQLPSILASGLYILRISDAKGQINLNQKIIME